MSKKNLIFLAIVILVVGIISGLSIGMGITTKVMRPVPKPPKQTRQPRIELPKKAMNESGRVRVWTETSMKNFYCSDYTGELPAITAKNCFDNGGKWCIDNLLRGDECFTTRTKLYGDPVWGDFFKTLNDGKFLPGSGLQGACPPDKLFDPVSQTCVEPEKF